ncbi:MAG: winged helix-turn-helix transcriptional regulator [Candidatus Pacearchaeota archaeon]
MGEKFDLKDRKILFELDRNARQSNSQIAKKVGLSKDAVGYRIKKLEEKKVLSGYRTVIDFSRLGFTMNRILLNLVDINENTLKKLISFLMKEEGVWLIGKNEGEWDFAFGYFAKSVSEFYHFYERFMSFFRKYLGTKLISQLVKYDERNRSYLIDKKPVPREKLNLNFEKVNVDEIDLKILKLISQNSRMRLVDIAGELNFSSMAIHQRIKKLEEKRIILGYKADINVLALGRDYYGVKVNLSDYSEKEKILNKIYSMKEMTAVLYHVGGYDIEFDLELRNTGEYHKIINSLRNEFSSIREIKSMRAIEYYKLTHFPKK